MSILPIFNSPLLEKEKTVHLPTGESVSGDWNDDKIEGRVTILYPNEDKFEGLYFSDSTFQLGHLFFSSESYPCLECLLMGVCRIYF